MIGKSNLFDRQFLFGLGIPMEVDVSTIMGYVMKCNYNLPYNASYLVDPYVRYQRSTAEAGQEDIIVERRPAGLAGSTYLWNIQLPFLGVNCVGILCSI